MTDCAAVQPPRESRSPWVAGVVAFAVAWWVFDLAVLRSGVPDRLDDTWEYGAAARALLQGHGFRTPVIHPPLWTLRDATNHVPVLVHGPLVPLLLAPFLAIFGPRVLDGIAWLAAAGAVATAAPLVRLGERCGDAAIGAAAAIVWTLAPLTLHSVHHDVSLPIGAALLVGSLELLTRPAPRRFASGVALGLAGLARPELLLALPLAALAGGASGWPILFGAALPLVPWWIHHTLAVGQPLFNLSSYLILGYGGGRPGIGVLRDFALTPARFGATLAAAWPAVLAKCAAYAPHAIKRALLAPVAALGWLAVLGAAFAIGTHTTRRVGVLLVAIAVIPIVVMSFTLYDDRYLVPFLPLFALGAARGAHDLAARMPAWAHRPRAWIGMLVLILLPAAAPAAREEAIEASHARIVLAAERTAIDRWTAALAASERGSRAAGDEVLFSDTPDLVAWTTGRPTVWLVPEEMIRLPRSAAVDRPARPDALHTWFHSPPP